jgi:hypothetical protein
MPITRPELRRPRGSVVRRKRLGTGHPCYDAVGVSTGQHLARRSGLSMRRPVPHVPMPGGWGRQEKATQSACYKPKGQGDHHRKSVESFQSIVLHDESDTRLPRHQDNTRNMFQNGVAPGSFVSQVFQAEECSRAAGNVRSAWAQPGRVARDRKAMRLCPERDRRA